MSEYYSVQPMEACVPVDEYLDTCVNVEKFLGYCRECGNYKHRWSCPPFDFEPVTLWKQYRTFRVFARILTVVPGTGLPAMLKGMMEEKSRLMHELLELEHSIPGSLALSAGGCSLCGNNCTRPRGEPCCKPNEMRYSIDALGGDMSETMERYFQKPILWIKNGEIPDYLTLVGGLLLREENQ
ncbi:MAG: DUF2284 domain-containing protein [Candidatus Heteroscillospira sp.]|jgi:predicted metal-binding protein